MFASTNEDLPLFSNTTQAAHEELFAPKPEIKQESMFDMRPEIGQRIEDAQIKIKNGETPEPQPMETKPATRESSLLNALKDKLTRGEWFAKSRDFEGYIKNLGFDIEDEKDLNLAYDLMEGAYNLHAREIRARLDADNASIADRIKAMDQLESQLTEARRTLGKMKLQQFSTPFTISEATNYVADIREGDIVGEPTGGTGNLVDMNHDKPGVTVRVNEIDPGRQEVLKQLGYDPTGLNLMAGEWLFEDGKKRGPFATVVKTNPPWGSYSTGKYGKAPDVPVPLNDWSQRFTYLTLLRMPEDGRFVGVMPANWLYTLDRSTRATTTKESAFYKWLKNNYTVQAVIESPPGAYKQRATDISSLLVVIDKTPPSVFGSEPIERFAETQPQTWDEYAQHLESVPKRTQEAIDHAQQQLRPIVAGPDATGIYDPAARQGLSDSDVANIGQPLATDNKPRLRHPNRTTEGGTGLPTGEPAGTSLPDLESGNQAGDTRAEVVGQEPAGISGPTEPFHYSDGFIARREHSREKIRNSASFTEYVSRAPITPEDAHPHPTVVVETKSLAGVPYPTLEEEYRPSASVMQAMKNRTLSTDGNIDPIWAAVQQNDKNHMGILIGDDVGMGKSRTGAGFVIDRVEKGKKRILWVTKGTQNVLDLMDELPQVWKGQADENGAYITQKPNPNELPAKIVHLSGANFPEVKKGTEAIPTFDQPTIYFVTANEFQNFGQKLVELHPDVALFDEAHMFKNSSGVAKYAEPWVNLHKDLIRNDASIMYLTATPAVDVSELRYLYGLRAWTMDGFNDWIGIITGQTNAEQVKKTQAARGEVDNWLERVNKARDEIDAQDAIVKGYGSEQHEGLKVGEFGFYKPTESYNKGSFMFEHGGRVFSVQVGSETQAIILAQMVTEKMHAYPEQGAHLSNYDIQSLFTDAKRDFADRFKTPGRDALASLDIKDSDDVINKQDKGGWGKKSLGAFDSTLSPAHTEQIMRELKVGGSFLSRDISRDGVVFDVAEYKPTPEAKQRFAQRVQLYRRIYEAWSKYGKMNEGASKMAAAFGINGDIQADAKRALFDMRLPGIIDEANKALDRGQKVVISIVSVGSVDDEAGSLLSAVNKINTHKVEKIGKDEFTDPADIPEAMNEVGEIKEQMHDFGEMPSPIDVLTDAFRDRIAFVHGGVAAKARREAQKAFQRGDIDVIVISGAGKTGINLHDINGKNQVHLIVGDYEWSPTTFKQELGRVDRTGQRSSPEVTVMHTGSAAERKFVSTIANRMKGLGAASKGGAESTGTGALTDNFELGSTIDKIALNEAWQDFPEEWKSQFLDPYFHDKTIQSTDGPAVTRSTLDTNSRALNSFMLALQTIEPDTANVMLEAYLKKREELMSSGSELDDREARKTSSSTGEVLRQTQLSDNLRMTEVKNVDGQKYAIVDGVLSPHMNSLRGIINGGEMQGALASMLGGNSWMRWVQFFDEKKGEYISGLQVPPGKTKAAAEYFGKAISSNHTPDSALTDLRAGDRIKIIGEDGAAWELYLGRGGSREGKIVVDGARLKNKNAVMNNGAAFNPIGNFFYIPEEKIAQFFKRFPISQDAPPPTLYQDAPIVPDANGQMPLGAFDQASGFLPESEVRDEGWTKNVKPLLDSMRNVALDRLTLRPGEGATRDLSPEGQDMLRRYLAQVKGDMATTKLATIRWGENQRDYAMHNYNRRYGFDKGLETVYPYELYYTRAMLRWAQNAIDIPHWYANYARGMQQTARYENDLPERLRGKIRIPAPWLPKWAGDSIYIDPLPNLFPPATLAQPFDRMQQDNNQQLLEAQRVLQEWAKDGKESQADVVQAAKTQSGNLWDRALAEAKVRRESEIANPADFMQTMLGPAWYLSAPLNAAGIQVPGISKGDPNEISTLPITNTARGLQTVTKGTFAEPVGDLLGLLSKPEEFVRNKADMPTLGQYQDYYIKRQIANMVAEGKLTSEQAQIAMAEGQGDVWNQATERVKMEMALRVPTMGALYAGLHNGPKGLAESALPSLFGAGLLPEGELKFRGEKDEWDDAWKKYDAGDTGAINQFFDKHPDYESYLAKNKSPEDQLRSFLVGQVWDGYMALGDTNKKAARAQMGKLFTQAFLDKETRSYESVPIDQLTQWAQMLHKETPQLPSTETAGGPASTNPAAGSQELNLYPEDVTKITDEFYRQRAEKFPHYYELEQKYYNLPQSQQTKYLLEHPELKAYQSWRNSWYNHYPELKPILNGQAFKTIDTSTWSPALVQYVNTYAMTGQPLGKGAQAALQQIWIREGRPNGDFKTWLNTQVVPALQYQQPQQ
jgi:hypothetical protein